ncbi:MAG: hypothetical protein GY946_23040 [bacterium]|nr:hypothetical protein [bacterium]
MQVLMLSSILLSTVMGTVVGLKLLLLASRTRQFPELAIGGALVCYATLAQVSLMVTHAIGQDASHTLKLAMLGLRLFAFHLTLIGLSTFTWRVFGASSRWRMGLTISLAITAIVTMGGTFWAVWHEITIDGALPTYARVGSSPQYAVVFGWMSIESLRYQRLMRKRQVLGLADPVVANRFGVWGLFAGASSLLVVALTAVMIRTTTAQFGTDFPSVAIISATGLVNALGWWLTFMPPLAYTEWVGNRAATRRVHPPNAPAAR